jgi:hypothetical protein
MPRSTKSSLVLALLLTACGGGSAPSFVVHQTAVVVRSDAPFARVTDLPERFESTVDAALEYWGGSWKDLEDSTITLEGGQHVQCRGSRFAIGCRDGREIRISTRDPRLGPWNCLEATVLVHEIGHAVIDDPDHTDPRWMDFAELAAKLDGRRGYEGTCKVYLNVWRQPSGG